MAEKEFDKELAEVPEGVLPDVIKLLKELIAEDTSKAFEYIESDPLASVAITTILRDFKNSDDELVEAFKKEYFKRIEDIFSLKELSNKIGMAFAVELMLGKWRQLTQSLEFDSTIDHLLSNLTRMQEEVNQLDPTPGNRVIFEMVNDSLRRIESFQDYERDKAKENVEKIQPYLENAIFDHIKQNEDLSLTLTPWLNLASMKHQTALELRETIRNICLSILKEKFPTLPEEEKFKLAAWLIYLEKDKESENKDSENNDTSEDSTTT